MTKTERAPPPQLTNDPGSAALLIGLAAGLAWAPFWLGSNRPFAWGVNALYFPFLAFIYESSVMLGRRGHAVSIRHLAVPAALFGVSAAWALTQSLPIAPESLAHPIWKVAGEAVERPVAGAISVNPTETFLALLRLLTDASVFWLALQLCRESRRADLLLGAIGVIVAIYASYGLVLAYFFDSVIPFFDAPATTGGVRASFVNRSHFATYQPVDEVASG